MVESKSNILDKSSCMVNSDMEIITELEKTNKRLEQGKIKFYTIEECYKKNMNFIDNFKM